MLFKRDKVGQQKIWIGIGKIGSATKLCVGFGVNEQNISVFKSLTEVLFCVFVMRNVHVVCNMQGEAHSFD